MDLSWMAWTPQTAAFFIIIAGMLVGMTVWGILAPQSPRLGILRFETTPGDRLFISLLGSAYINLAWLGIIGPPLWGALAVCAVFALCVVRWV